jgi:hypothetical protein
MSTLRFPSSRARAGLTLPARGRNRLDLACETLESRQLLSTITAATDLSQIQAQPDLQAVPLVSSGPTGLSPQQITTAYGVNQVRFSGGAVTGDGSGQTIAIVTAFNDPNIGSDLASFDSHYNITNPSSFSLNVANLGATTTDAGWALETSLDVEWAHAMAPGAKILLVEAASDNFSDLLNAVNYAKAQAGVSDVSMSWGGSEFWGEANYDSTFTTPSGHTGVTFVAASGDSGAWGGPSYPAASPNVLAVGGTTLSLNSSNTITSETGWSGSTGGFSGYDMSWWSYEAAPSYQNPTLNASGLNYGIRTTPDVSFNADPNSGVSVFDSVSYSGQSGWFQLGGTSAAAPAWAGLVAIADQGLASAGRGVLANTQAQAALYDLPSSDFHDATSGSNGYSASTGYDLVTGLGSPRANLVIPGVLSYYGVSSSVSAAQATVSTTTVTSTVRRSSHFDVTTGGIGSPAASSNSSPANQATSQSATTLQVQALATPTAPSLTPAQSSSQPAAAATAAAPSQGLAAPAPAQSLIPQSTWRSRTTGDGEPGPAPLVDAVESARPAAPNTEEAPAPEQAPAPEDAPVAPPIQAKPAAAPTMDDFDMALQEVSWSLSARRLELISAPLNDTERIREDQPAWSMPAVAGTVAVAAGGYRLVLGRPDRIRRRWRPGRLS